MNNKFDELTKSLAQSVTRRAALKQLGVGLASMALACFGLANKAQAGTGDCNCVTDADCSGGRACNTLLAQGTCVPKGPGYSGSCYCKSGKTHLPHCSPYYEICVSSCRVALVR